MMCAQLASIVKAQVALLVHRLGPLWATSKFAHHENDVIKIIIHVIYEDKKWIRAPAYIS